MSTNPLPPLDGSWSPVHARQGGEAAPELVLQQTRLEITAGRYRVMFGGDVVDTGALEPTPGLPQNMVFRSLAGAHAGRTLPAMYQHVGQRLRICYGLDGRQPEVFSAEAGEARYLVTYRREG